MSSYRPLVASAVAGVDTTDDDPVVLIAGSAVTGGARGNAIILNESAVPGFFSVDGGVVWARLAASYAVDLPGIGIESNGIQIKRIPGGTNLTGVFALAW